MHAVKVGGGGGAGVEELSPEQLTTKTDRGEGVLFFLTVYLCVVEGGSGGGEWRRVVCGYPACTHHTLTHADIPHKRSTPT